MKKVKNQREYSGTVLESSTVNNIVKGLNNKKKPPFFEKILSEAEASIVIFDLNSLKAVWSNDTLRRTLGLKESKSLTGEEVMLMYHPADQNFLIEMRNFFKTKPQGLFTAFYQFMKPGGKYGWFYTAAKLFKHDPGSGVLEVLGVTIDFSENLTYSKNLKLFAQDKLQEINKKQISRITPRERQLIRYFANGFSTREMAELLGLSFHTINNHRKNILNKLELKNLAALVNFAVENGLD